VLAAGADGSVILWDLATGKTRTTFSGHGKSVTDAVFSPDGTQVASVSVDQTLRVWDAASGAEICLYNLAGGLRIDFRDSNQLTTYDQSATLREFPLSVDRVIDSVRKMARPLKSDECKRYFGDQTCPVLQ
jgi:WD40 repeat protein